MPCFDLFFSLLFCEKKDVFRDFSPEIGKKQAKTSKNKQKYHPNQESLQCVLLQFYSCYSSFRGYTHLFCA